MTEEFIPKNELPVGAYAPYVYTDRWGYKRQLEHTFEFSPGETLAPLFADLSRDVETIVGKEALESLRGKTVVVAHATAGWGHTAQAFILAAGLQAVGARVILTDVQELATPEERIPFGMKQTFLKSFHAADGGAPQWNLNRKFALDTWLGDAARLAAMELALSQVRNVGWGKNGKPTFLDKAVSLAGKFMENNKTLRGLGLRVAVAADQQLFDKEISPAFTHFCHTVDAQAVLATHSSPARALLGTPYEGKTILAIPDPGYGISPEFLSPMIALGKSITTGTPSAEITRYLKEYFKVPPERILDNVGTLTLAESRIAREKWQRPERVIMLSTSGNATHLPIITRAIEEFSEELKKEHTPYRLIVFLGDHPDDTVSGVLDSVAANGLADNSRIQVVRANSSIESAALKWWCKLHAHVEITKPGEQPLDNPQMGTLTIGLPAGFANEPVNLAVSYFEWQASIPSAWPKEVYAHWRSSPEFHSLKAPGFERPYDNIVDYLDYLYGNNEYLENFARSYAAQGRYQAPKDALLRYLIKAVDVAGVGADTDRIDTAFHKLVAKRHKDQLWALVSGDWRYAYELSDLFVARALEATGSRSIDAFIKEVAPKTAIMTIHGGAGTRWISSFETRDAGYLAQSLGISPDEAKSMAKGLIPVPNMMPESYKGSTMPILGYTLHAVMPFIKSGADHTIIYSGNTKDEVGISKLLHRMNIQNSRLVQQRVREGKTKVTGHGDALLQQLPILREMRDSGRKYLAVQMVGVPSSAFTACLGVLTLDALSTNGYRAAGVLPTAKMEKPIAPVFVDDNGQIQSLGHKKLLGEESVQVRLGQTLPRDSTGHPNQLSTGGSNVGVFLFRLDSLIPVLEEVERQFEQEGNFLFLPGHRASGVDEFAVDDLMPLLASRGESVVQAATAHPDEIVSAVKTIGDIPEYLSRVKQVLERDTVRFAIANTPR